MCISNLEMLQILAKPWARSKDIELLNNCGSSKAKEIRKKIEEKITESGKLLPMDAVVPMEMVVKELHINEKRIERYARLEAEGLIKKVPAGTGTQKEI